MNLPLTAKPAILQLRALEIRPADRQPGGVYLKLGDQSFEISRKEAIDLGSAILRIAGCNVNFDAGPRRLI